MNLDDARQTFISNNQECLNNKEEVLLGLEQSPQDSDSVTLGNTILHAEEMSPEDCRLSPEICYDSKTHPAACDNVFAIPPDILDGCVELSTREMQEPSGCDSLKLRGEVLPSICLKPLFTNAPTAPAPKPKINNIDSERKTVFQNITGASRFTMLNLGRVAFLIVDVLNVTQHVTRWGSKQYQASRSLQANTRTNACLVPILRYLFQ